MKADVIDPTKAARTALTNAVSDALVADIPKEEKAMPAMPPGGDMY